MKILFTPIARTQFLAAISYILLDKPSAATLFRQRAEKSLKRLLKYPESGRPIPEFPELPFRVLIVPPYRFFYRVKEDVVWIVAAWHGAQIPEEPI